ncbi:hypothetical protein B0H11DRAFT_1908755 [Mycena galericulata]|nr:hypothetical protein B0H11DRAFT_1908755 [Mycena galericulata]
MCDERTASKLTATSTAKRNNLGAVNLVRCAKLDQYWRYGFGKQEVQQHYTSSLLTKRRSSTPPDPDGIKDLDAMEEDEDDTDTAAPPLVTRRANLPTLEIEVYIDVNVPKLVQRFASDQAKPPATAAAQPAKKPAKDPKSQWAMEYAKWDAAEW